jgi:hypothetical protein
MTLETRVYECPGCGAAMELGGMWIELIDEDGHDVPPCPGCDDETGDTWGFDPRVSRTSPSTEESDR